MVKHPNQFLKCAAALLCAPFITPVTIAEESGAAIAIEEVVVVGTRRQARSVGDSPAPIDVIGGEDFENQGGTDLLDLLRTLVPSYNVNAQPISDAATLVRPANLRGLPPDNTLVLVNGKRHHRGAVISFLGGGLSDGAQGPDISVFPAIGLKQVEVLRDGAAAQYGSDAIAGVINFVPKDSAEGLSFEAKTGETYKGDGAQTSIAANVGLPFTDNGFANFSLEYSKSDATSRSDQRADAAALIAGGNTAVADPAQIWGNPDIDDSWKFMGNIGLDLNDTTHAYLFGNYAEKKVLGGFFFRNPTNRGGIFSLDEGTNYLVGDLNPDNPAFFDDRLGAPDGLDCAADLDRTVPATGAGSASDTVLANLMNTPGCFVFNSQFPGGFTPNFGGTVYDYSAVAGVSGEAANGLLWDVSIGVGSSSAEFLIKNTINPSLGLATPTVFRPGDYTQLEKNINADFSYPVNIDAFASPLNVAFGFEYREEQFEITAGDTASWEAGPFFKQGFGIGSNGFGGFNPSIAGKFDRGNAAAYVDLETDITDQLLLGAALRYEHFDDFGDTVNGKLSARFAPNEIIAFRATVSTGFRAPTPGQSNVQNVTTTSQDDGVLVQRGTIPSTNPVAISKGGKPLDSEDSTSFSAGFVWDATDSLNLTVDYFNIELKDRITQSATKQLTPEEVQELVNAGITGAGDLNEFRFYTNDFDTTTQGIDVVGTWSHEWDSGVTDVNLAYNWTETKLDKASDVIDYEREGELERSLPETRWTLTGTHLLGDLRMLLRVSYYDEWTDPGESGPAGDITFGDEFIVDAEVSYTIQEKYTLSLGARNLLNEYPDKEPRVDSLGYRYPEASPTGFNGGYFYGRIRIDL
ncbi:MAG: TonB-dependent receptor [Pseudomonadales bacterium]|nr:TonB-dependent receptor [Pseudomonadales bacterium]